jgi:hypothetical protein
VENLIHYPLNACGKLWIDQGRLKGYPQVFHSFSTGFPQPLWKSKRAKLLINSRIAKKVSSFPQVVVKHRTCGTVENQICGKSEPDLWKTCGKLLMLLESL